MNSAKVGAHIATFISMALAARYGLISAGISPADLLKAAAPTEVLLDGSVRVIAAAFVAWVGAQILSYPFSVWRKGHPLVGVAVFVLLTAAWLATLLGSIGAVSTDSDRSNAKAAGTQHQVENARSELKRIENDIKGLPASRPVESVEAAIRAAKVNPIYAIADNCRSPQIARGGVAFCTSFEKLNEELGVARQKASLSSRIDGLREQSGIATPSGNAQAKTIASLFGTSAELSEAMYALLFALAIEFAAIGLNLAGVVMEKTTGYPDNQARPHSDNQLTKRAGYPVSLPSPITAEVVSPVEHNGPTLEMKQASPRRFVLDDAAVNWAAGK